MNLSLQLLENARKRSNTKPHPLSLSLTFPRFAGLMWILCLIRWRLRGSPSNPNENGEFELSWAWEPIVSSRTSLHSEDGSSLGRFPHGNALE